MTEKSCPYCQKEIREGVAQFPEMAMTVVRDVLKAHHRRHGMHPVTPIQEQLNG